MQFSPAAATVSSSPSARMSQARTRAPRAAKATAIARPKPCAAPVTMRCGRRTRCSCRLPQHRPEQPIQLVEIGRVDSARLPLSISWMSAMVRLAMGMSMPCAPADLDRPARAGHPLRSCACGPRGRARCRNGSSPNGGCGRPYRRRNARSRDGEAPGRKAFGSKPLKASSRTPSAAATAAISCAEPGEERPVALLGEKIGDALVGDRGREELRAVDHLGPEIAPDVGGQDRRRDRRA